MRINWLHWAFLANWVFLFIYGMAKSSVEALGGAATFGFAVFALFALELHHAKAKSEALEALVAQQRALIMEQGRIIDMTAEAIEAAMNEREKAQALS